jgi:hypothetical protein
MANHPRITDPAMNSTRAALLALLALFALLASCRENPVIDEPNKRPTADARVIWRDMSLDETIDAGPDGLKFDFDGTTPVEITLDGSSSVDADGEIVKYEWHSATLAGDGGVPEELRMVPNGDGAWPPDEMQPKITITAAGVYSFALWVHDDKGAKSEPDTVKITVGTAVDPAIAECMTTVAPSVPATCSECLCSTSEQCRNDVKESACNEACWTFLRCLGTKCPDFRTMAMQMPPDYSCLTANCMAEYTAGMAGATPAGACVTACGEVCRSMPTMM